MRSPFPRQPLTGTCDGSGNLTVGNQLRAPSSFWALIYIAASVSAGTPFWSVLLGSSTGIAQPLANAAGRSAVLGPFLLQPNEPAALVIAGATPGAVLQAQALGYQSDDPAELLSAMPGNTSTAIFTAPQAAFTYSASGALGPAANPTDIIEMFLPAGSTVIARLTFAAFSAFQNVARLEQIQLIARGSRDTGGTPTALGFFGHDPNDPGPQLQVNTFGTNPGISGVALPFRTRYIDVPAVGDKVDAQLAEWIFGNRPNGQAVAIAPGQGVYVNLGGSAQAGANYTFDLEWTESAT